MDHTNSSRKTILSDYENNPLLKLVFYCGAGYVALHLVKIVVFMWQKVPMTESTQYFYDKIFVHFAIQPLDGMISHPWAILAFMFTGLSFFKLFTSMMWLFLFGNVVQQLVGKSEVVPMFLITNIIGAIIYVALLQFFPIAAPNDMFAGADASVLGFAIGVSFIAPRYKVFFSSNFSVPLWLLSLIYLVLTGIVLFGSRNYPHFGLLAGGVLAGIIYLAAARRGLKPGAWMNKVWRNGVRVIAPKRKVGDRTFDTLDPGLDAILDKINERGIQSLTKEEREILKQFQ